MGKLTAIKTYDVFMSRYDLNQIDEKSVTFIIETGQIYTHGIFINGASFGTEASGAINLIIGNTTKSLALASHTHNNYYSNTANIDIGANKVVSGAKDLLLYNSSVKVGDTSVPLILQGSTDITVTKSSTSYTLLDTGNFSIEEKTTTGISSLNALTFNYGSNKVSIDYVRHINTSSTFDSIAGNNNVGINALDSKLYGVITMSDMGLPLYYAQIRANITDHVLEFRDSGSTTWKTILTSSAVNALGVAGIVLAPSAGDANKVWGTDASGNPGWISGGNLSASSATNIAGGAAGSIPYQTGSGTTSFLTGGSDGYVLAYNATDNIPYWKAIVSSDTWRNVYLNGTSKVGTDSNTKAINFKAGSNVGISYEAAGTGTGESGSADYFNIIFSSTWTANAVDTAGYVAAPTKAANANMTWQTDADGNPSWRASNSHSHDYLPLSGGTATSTANDWGYIFLNKYGGSVKSIFYVASAGGYGAHLRGYTTSSSVYLLEIYNNSSKAFAVYGDLSSSFGGNVTASNFYTSSDLKLKKNITSILPIADLNFKQFNWKKDDIKSYGLIALEVEKQYPELVEERDGIKSVNYQAALCLSVGQLLKKVKELEEKIKQLENG